MINNKKIKKILNNHPKKIILGSIFLLFCLVLTVTFSINLLSHEEIRSVEIASNGWETNEPGSWHITKSAEWTGYRTARVTFDVDTVIKIGEVKKDIILILDVSGSMSGNKLSKVKEDATELVEAILSDEMNRVALIKFDTKAEILSTFTNDKETLLNQIEVLSASGSTNYADALRKTEEILEGYVRPTNKDLVALFLSDGYPCEETPNQIGEYAILKDNHPDLTVNAIQYEMGSSIIQQLIEISDNQYLAYVENLENVLFDAVAPSHFYDYFVINDFINDEYFELGTVENVSVSIGEVSLTIEDGLEKVTWDLGTDFRTGSKATMTIDIKLKDDVEITDTSLFPTNKKEDITTKLPEEPEDIVKSDKTPKLKGAYKVIYDVNTPNGCSLTSPSPETHIAYETVTIRSDELVCSGYLFKGWEITDESSDGIQKINDETFIMPGKDVYIRGVWTQVAISKSMIAEEYNVKYIMPFNGEEGYIDNAPSPYVTNSTGINFNEISSDENGKGLYVRAGTEEDEYPIFYYRGAVTNNSVLFANKCWKIVRTTETGGTKLIYNGIPDESNADGMCANTGTASQLSSTRAFNSSYQSPADVGYMVGTRYAYKSKDMSSSGGYDVSTVSIAQSEYINVTNDATYPYTYDASTNQWTSDTKNTNSAIGSIQFSVATAGEYYFAYDVSSEANYDYVTIAVNGTNKTSAKELSGTKTGTIALGNLSSSDVIKVTYTKDSSGNSGRDNVIFSIAKASGTAVDNRWLYGNSVSYYGGTYTLQDTKKVTWGDSITSNHYTCFSTGATCTTVNYIYYISGNTAYYIELTGGKKVEDALDEMLTNSSNANDSTIKDYIENTWYSGSDGMLSYDSYLEDTIWCNDRGINDLGGWNPNGGSTSRYLYFEPSYRTYTSYQPSLVCENPNDRFTVSTENGNGKSKYKVGLITSDEAMLGGLRYGASNKSRNTSSYLYTSQYYFTLSPYYFGGSFAYGILVYPEGSLYSIEIHNAIGVRPAISLHSGVTASSGDGSAANPYRVY